MARLQSSRQPLDVAKESVADRIEERSGKKALRWSFVLICFMRMLAVLWFVKGVSAWAMILGIWTPAGLFELRPTGLQAAIIYFAVIDLVAAVGLWMASSWGGVVWLLAVMSHLILAAFFRKIVALGMPAMGLFVVLIVGYLVISWLSAREE
jgi:Family of unknown function (DUF6163)